MTWPVNSQNPCQPFTNEFFHLKTIPKKDSFTFTNLSIVIIIAELFHFNPGEDNLHWKHSSNEIKYSKFFISLHKNSYDKVLKRNLCNGFMYPWNTYFSHCKEPCLFIYCVCGSRPKMSSIWERSQSYTDLHIWPKFDKSQTI